MRRAREQSALASRGVAGRVLAYANADDLKKTWCCGLRQAEALLVGSHYGCQLLSDEYGSMSQCATSVYVRDTLMAGGGECVRDILILKEDGEICW